MANARQHAKGTLKGLRILITALQNAQADGVSISFVQDAAVDTGTDEYLLAMLPTVSNLNIDDITARADETSSVTVTAAESVAP
jgi:hypothetical protein